jgi:predicted transcriptional regulator
LRPRLFPGRHSAQEEQRLAARVSRLLRLLRAHGLIKKLGKTHRYQVTKRGREIIAALQTARRTKLDALLEIAA